MTESEACEQILGINQAVVNIGAIWVDVDVAEINPYSALINCRTTLSQWPDLEIQFGAVFVALLPMAWSCDMALPVLEMITGDDAFRLNRLYQVETGFHWFLFHPKDFSSQASCLIAAESVSWRLVPQPST